MAFQISVAEQSNLFKQHLEEEGNDRILFSGAFGTGKTYFLDKFFSTKDKDFLTIKLSPINYSVSSNEDIFTLIKYDILFELLLSHKLKLDGEQISYNVAYGLLLPTKAESIMKGMFGVLGLLNKDIEAIPTIISSFTDWFTAIKEIEKQRKDASQNTEAISFLEEVSSKFSLEQDDITTFIKHSLTEIAETDNKCKVLIIDDLDRIDPEHTFRLFNIFSAHLDYHRTYRNKFGFDKVIFVCDVQNIRNTFHSRYGTGTDFTGYIDKFYNKEVFEFSNVAEIRKVTNKLINSIQFDEEYEEYFQTAILRGARDKNQSLLEILITELISAKAFNIRRITESHGTKYKITGNDLSSISFGRRLYKMKVPALITLEIISKMLGGSEAFLKSSKLLNLSTSTESYLNFIQSHADWLAGTLIPLADYKNHKFRTNTDYVYESDNMNIGYQLNEVGNRREEYYASISSVNGLSIHNSSRVPIDVYSILIKAIEEMRKAGVLR